MRVGLFIGSAILAGAGVAVAQSDWVVDPWSSSTTQQASPAQLAAQAGVTPASEGWFDELPAEWADPRSTEPTNPWSSSPSSAPAAPAEAAHAGAQTPLASVSAPGAWAKPVTLVVDPWAPARVRTRAPAVDLIVDPWARDRTRH